jgi:6,7-dimethyl-8-ribityllumazine synthase
MQVGLDSGRPVAFGVLTTENMEQALARSAEPGDTHGHNAGADCAAVVLEMLAVLESTG